MKMNGEGEIVNCGIKLCRSSGQSRFLSYHERVVVKAANVIFILFIISRYFNLILAINE